MAARLKSILRRILSSSVLKAAVFGLAWFLLPFWLFLPISLYLFFSPAFRSWDLLLPFSAVVFLAAIEPQNFLLAALFAAVFYLILGTKNLVFTDREGFGEILVLLVLFLMLINFFARFDSWAAPAAFFYSFLIGVVFFFMAKKFLADYGKGAADSPRIRFEKYNFVVAGILSLVLWQISLAALFLPLNFLYQAAVVFLAETILLELASDYLRGRLTRKALLLNFSVFAVFLTAVLGSAQWGL